MSDDGYILEMAASVKSERGRVGGMAGLTRKPLPDDDKRACLLGRQVMRVFVEESRRGIPIGYVDTFLMIAADEGKSVNEYAEMAHVSKSVMSRHILDIGDWTRAHEPGLGWVTSRPHPMELRRHEVYLTPKGRVLAHRLREVLNLWVKR
jgi:DNA-binding MarR family transcriptional regulator